MTTKREKINELLYINRILIHNLLVSDATKLDQLVQTCLDVGGDENSDSVFATRRDAKFRRDLAEELHNMIIDDDYEVLAAEGVAPYTRNDVEVDETGLSESGLKAIMRDPAYWRDQDPELVEKVNAGFRKLYST